MREIIFDTETTGLDSQADRIIEIGAVELDNRFPTGRTFHMFINPDGREVHPDAYAVHGISNESLVDKPRFAQVIDQWLDFVGSARLVAHNATFDIAFVNAEMSRAGFPAVDPERVIDSLAIARRRHPMGPNSLDALCKRYGIDNSHRTKHGALLDSELLAEVYIELVGGKQASLGLSVTASSQTTGMAAGSPDRKIGAMHARPEELPPRLTQAEIRAHQQMIERLGDAPLWRKR